MWNDLQRTTENCMPWDKPETSLAREGCATWEEKPPPERAFFAESIWAWVLNRSLAAATVRDPVLVRLADAELRHPHRVRDLLAERLADVTWQGAEIVGADRLAILVAPPVPPELAE